MVGAFANLPSESSTFRRTLLRAVLYPVLLLVLLILIFLWQLGSLVRTTEQVERSDTVITQAMDVLKLMVDMETGLRGYLLTDDPRFLDPYGQAKLILEENFQALEILVQGNPLALEHLHDLQAEIQAWQNFAETQLRAEADGLPVNNAAIQLNGKQQMDAIRQHLRDFIDTEEDIKTSGLMQARTTAQVIVASVVTAGILVGGLLALNRRQQLIALSTQYERVLKVTSDQAEEISTRKEWLQGVLSSIGDAVIATDLAGTITFINPVTTALTGWPADEAIGKPLSDVFVIRSEDEAANDALMTPASPLSLRPAATRQLIARNGTRIAVEDNTTALRDSQGRSAGTVLVFRDVTRRNQIERERLDLIKTQIQYASMLRQSNEQLQQFAYVASHDLQEPLRMIISYLQLLEKRYTKALDSDAHEFISYAVDGAARMKELISALLAYARLDTGQPDIHESVALEEVLQQALDNLSVAIADSGAVITHDALPEITGNALQLMQLFQNLIGNAIKFRSAGPPKIHIGAQKIDGEWQFSVHDNGIGIAPEFQDRIFRLFQRLHSRADYPGTGIGLATCKKVVELHGGAIRIESKASDGATFYFTLPGQPRPTPAIPSVQ